ncbi:hypothetical protein ACTI_80040 [Actinoplanes sp. OR16]|nr:hypothetical protein ACTI_80040 [Actinoplanes sp. OR16]
MPLPAQSRAAVSSATPAPVSTAGEAFYRALRPGPAAMLTRQPKSLAAAFAESTAVVVAEVTAVTEGRLIGDMQTAVVDLDVIRVLHGDLQPGLPDTRVEFGVSFLPEPIAPLVGRMHADVPRGPAVWLLKWQGRPAPDRKPGAPRRDPTADLGLYNIVHYNCAILVDGPDRHVVSAIAQDGDPFGAQAEAESYPDLDTLIRQRTP